MNDPALEQTIEDAAILMQSGGVVIFPTETAYGIGCDYENQKAIDRIMQVKARTDRKFTLVASSLEQVQEHFELNEKALELAAQHWPGPLSIAVDDQFSIRVPDHEVPRLLAEKVGKPIIATSANKSGNPPTYTTQGIRDQLGKRAADIWIDVGELPEVATSTVVRCTDDSVEVIRQGTISL